MKNINILDLCFNKTWKKVLLMLLSIVFLNFLVSVITGFNIISNISKKFMDIIINDPEHITQVSFNSDNWIEEDNVEDLAPGSWKVEKSAEWTSNTTAKVTFDIRTGVKTSENSRDIILVLDTSGSMDGNKLDRVKQDASGLVDYVLNEEGKNNRVAVVTFSTKSQILTNENNNYFMDINDITKIEDLLSSLEAKGGTNYAAALRNVSKVVEGYTKESKRDLIVMFLTDGYPAEEHPSERNEYSKLKSEHSYIEINGVQYEMNNSEVIKQIKDISDKQYLAFQSNLRNVLMEIMLKPEVYENFELTDYINDRNFEIESEESVEVSLGRYEVDLNSQSIKWDMSNELISGSTAQMSINLKLKEPYNTEKGRYPTNKGENLKFKLGSESHDKRYDHTPVLKNNFEVIYNSNAPEGCNIRNVETKTYFVYEQVKLSEMIPVCPGYTFKGWEIVENDVQKLNDEEFIMPIHKVTVGGQWTKVGINKSFSGSVIKKVKLWDQVKSDYENNARKTKAKVITETEDDEYPIYYYYYGSNESETNKYYNYVYYAGYCWKMIRTTETGGVKLLYYGTYENGMCISKTIGSSKFNNYTVSSYSRSKYGAPSYLGYMYDTVYNGYVSYFGSNKSFVSYTTIDSSNTYYFSNEIEFVDGKYILKNAEKLQWGDNWRNLNGYYTCKNNNDNTCSFLYYILGSKEKSMDILILESYNNHTSLSDVNIELLLSENITQKNDGTYELNSPIKKVSIIDWYNEKFSDYENHYVCSDLVSSSCENMYFVKSTFNKSFDFLEVSKNYKYGNDVVYEKNSEGIMAYKLIDTQNSNIKKFWNWKENSDEDLKMNHYTCFNKTGECETVYYIYSKSYHSYYSRYEAYYISLKNGNKIFDALNQMIGFQDYEGSQFLDINQKDSIIKTFVDNWYENNIKNNDERDYEDYLENTVYCNNRKVANLNAWDPNNNIISNRSGAISFYTKNIDLECPNFNDRFTIDDREFRFTKKDGDILANGNGKLKYPIGLLTNDELNLIGKGFLPKDGWWTGSPYNLNEMYATVNLGGFDHWVTPNPSFVGTNGWAVQLSGEDTRREKNVRPVVSLRYGTMYVNAGDGSKENPYRIGGAIEDNS